MKICSPNNFCSCINNSEIRDLLKELIERFYIMLCLSNHIYEGAGDSLVLSKAEEEW